MLADKLYTSNPDMDIEKTIKILETGKIIVVDKLDELYEDTSETAIDSYTELLGGYKPVYKSI